MSNKLPKRVSKFYGYILNTRIRELLAEKGYKAEGLANALKISVDAVRMWCAGYSRPDIEKLPLISEYFSVSVDYLLGNFKAVAWWDMARYYRVPQHIKSLHSTAKFLCDYIESDDVITIPAELSVYYGFEQDEEQSITPEKFYLPQLPNMLNKIRVEYWKQERSDSNGNNN